MRQNVSSLAPLMPFFPTYSTPQTPQKPTLANEQQENLFPLHYESTATDTQQYMGLDNSFKPYHIGARAPFDYASAAQGVQFPSFRDPYIERPLHLPDSRDQCWNNGDRSGSLWSAQLNMSTPFCHAHPQCQVANREQSKYNRNQNIKPHESEGMNSSKEDRRSSQNRTPSKRNRPTESAVRRSSRDRLRKRAATAATEGGNIDKALLIQLRDQLEIDKKSEDNSKVREAPSKSIIVQ
jgi:hypothetical protein